MSKTLFAASSGPVILAGFLVVACAEQAAAQCYPGLACPTNPEPPPPPPPQVTGPVPPQDNAATAQTGGRSFWMHNGSLLYLVAEGDKRSFYYEKPRPGVQAAGARPGALLFEGRRQGPSYAGTAYIFAGRCGTIAYAVRGAVSNNDRRVTMAGNAPSGISGDCQVTGWRHDVLVFDYSHRE